MKCIVLAAVLFLCSETSAEEDGPSKERSLSDLPDLLNSEEGIEEIYKEFEAVESGKRRPWTVAELPQNIKKNRYDDLLAFDHSRVVLKQLPDDPYSDYINANYINGQNSEKEYIATQGPLNNTIDDFWRMIVQENVTRIVMLANLTEKGETKVEKYWPETNELYGDIEVTKVTENSIPSIQHVVRTFSVKQAGNNKPQIVRHFHFTGWPDLGVPSDRLPVISIIRQARLFDPNNKAPIVVHCSAGVGRTGTLILTDSMILKAKAEGKVDFQKRLDHMRTLRPDVVEKKEQYLFAYQSVNDVFNVEGTEQKLEAIEEEYRNLDKQKRGINLELNPHIQAV